MTTVPGLHALAAEVDQLRVICRDFHPALVVAGGRIKDLIAQGHSQAEVARRLGISRQTLSNHLNK